MKKLPKSWFEEWIRAICKARHSYLDPEDIDAWTFCFEWVIELKRAYAEQEGEPLHQVVKES